MRTRLAIFLSLLIGSNIATGLLVQKTLRPLIFAQADTADILIRIRNLNGPFIVILGDSITASAHLPESVCGLPLVNVGKGGGRASTFISFAEDMSAARLIPALTIVALGVNDAISEYHSDFSAAYAMLLNHLPDPLALATPAPVDRSAKIDFGVLQSIDGIIRSYARARNAMLIDLSKLPLQTSDGLHPTTNSYVLWNAAVVEGIERAMKC